MKQKKKIIIISGGEIELDPVFYKRFVNEGDYIICADSGTDNALKVGINPDIIVGDMDSINPQTLTEITNRNIEIHKYNPEKDFSDTEIAIQYAMTMNINEIIIFGAIGDRLDHTLSNIHLIKTCLEKGYNAKIVNKKNEVSLINDSIYIDGKKGDLVSLIPLTEEVEGVITDGLYYPLKDETLFLGSTRGNSNVMIDDKAIVKIKSGLLLVIKTFGE
jgi:thiamine pyrophosphokinase